MNFLINLVVASATFSTATLACTKKQDPSAPAQSGGRPRGARGTEQGPVSVRTTRATKKVTPRILETVVTLQGKTQADVYSKVLGRIRSLRVSEGKPVKRGELLAEIDRNDPGESFLSMPITSPIDGWVGRTIATVGTQVTPQDPILSVVEDSALRAEVFLPVSDWSHLSPSSVVTLILPDETRAGRIVSISRAADAATGRGSFVVEFQNKGRRLKAGMIASVRIEVEARERIVLPASALSVTDAGSFLFVVEDEAAKRVNIEYELLSNDIFEVTKGLSGGEEVVVEGTGRLFPGAKIKIQAESKDKAE